MLLLRLGCKRSSERAGFQDPLFDRLSLDNVLPKNAANPFWRDTSVPGAIGPDADVLYPVSMQYSHVIVTIAC